MIRTITITTERMDGAPSWMRWRAAFGNLDEEQMGRALHGAGPTEETAIINLVTNYTLPERSKP
jgi:hypothetical protein